MTKNLMIVESPAKAKTIERFLGDEFLVTSCYGHIRDLASNKLSVDTENGYNPEYVIPKEKEAVLKELKKLVEKAEIIWLATDEDREGEAIAWHLYEIFGGNSKELNRIVFHEITKTAIISAIENPRGIDENLVNAQQARRILDRLVGFELSPILWKKISFKSSLSAGRVQSVAVRLIVEREREIGSFEVESSFKVSAVFAIQDENGKTTLFKAVLPKRYKTEDEARSFLEQCKDASFSISDIQVKPTRRSPNAPFTTSTLQQEASRKIGYSVSKTMVIAQKLYESGKISYMRTDSVNLSDTALKAAEEAIKGMYGEHFSKPRTFENKTANAQEAHEAIRPTSMDVKEVEGDTEEKRLYDLIWKRTLASQMADAEIEKTSVRIAISTTDEEFVASGEVLKFEGFLKVYVEGRDEEDIEEDETAILPAMQVGQSLTYQEIQATERFTRPPARYTEATLVRKLEELGIGRPSTYAPTISTIQKRGYVVKENRDGNERDFRTLTLDNSEVKSQMEKENYGFEKNKLFPTDVGILVTDFLVEHFKNVMDYGFTAKIEKEFDEIATGQEEWKNMLDAFYKPFHEMVETTTQEAKRVTGERSLGDHPETGKPIYAKVARYGPVVQMGETDNDEKPKFASIRSPLSVETVTLEEALELFKLPRSVGEFEGEEVVAAEGRYGPYVQNQGKFYSIKEKFDPVTITLEEAIEVIQAKRESDAKKTIKQFEEQNIQVLNGRYGPYIKAEGKNIKIPSEMDPANLTLEQCLELIEKAPVKKSRRTRKKK